MLQVPGWKLGLRAEVLGRNALPALLPAWEDLCTRSVEDNVYYAPRYARALLETVERHKEVGFAVAWDGARLAALLPFTRARFAIPLIRPAAQAWQSKYTFSCMPLLDRLRKDEAAEALLNACASVNGGEWLFPAVNIEGEACRAMTAALERRALPWIFLEPFQRAALQSGSTFDAHMQRHVSLKRRKDLARNRRRLEQLGKVAHESYRFGDGLQHAVEAFLKIEAGGWKGQCGTALGCNEKTQKFAIHAFTGDESDSICRADVLALDGTPIAVSLIALAGRTGFTVKCCYDEAYRSFSAGLLLEVEVIRSLLSENWAERLDSATAGTHVIEGLWPGRIEVADFIFSLSRRHAQLRLAALHRSEQLRRSVRAGLKRALRRP